MTDSHEDKTQLPVLYGTSACHLCEQAEAMLMDLLPASGYRKVDISEDDALFDRYGWSIPVVARPDGQELNWPFELARLRNFLA